MRFPLRGHPRFNDNVSVAFQFPWQHRQPSRSRRGNENRGMALADVDRPKTSSAAPSLGATTSRIPAGFEVPRVVPAAPGPGRVPSLFLIAALLSANGPVHAQRASNWRAYKVADGLAQTACSSLTIGAQGKILVTHPAAQVITIVDGYNVTNIPSPGPHTGPVYESPAGQLWSPSAEGLHEFRDGEWILHPANSLAPESLSGVGSPATPDLSHAI